MSEAAAHRGQIVWLASYPKSGNTWLRFLACNLIFGVQDSAAALNQLAPDIHESPALQLPTAPLLVKTHFPYSPQLPLAEHTLAALYVVRSPADVIVSTFHYALRSGVVASCEAARSASAAQAAFERYVDAFLAARGDSRWIHLGIGCWDDHVRSWLQGRHPFPILVIRYEDLLADAAIVAGRICTFLGLQRSADEVQAAIVGASFPRMRQIEEADIRERKVGMFYKPYLQPSIQAGLRFMRSGRAGEAAQILGEEQRLRLNDVFGTLMRELGYPPDSRTVEGQVP